MDVELLSYVTFPRVEGGHPALPALSTLLFDHRLHHSWRVCDFILPYVVV